MLAGPQTSMRSDLAAFPAEVWVLLFGSFVNRFGTFVLPFLTLYLTRQGYTAAQAGGALGAYGVGGLAAAGAGGYLADRIGRERTIAVSMFSSAAAMVALSQAGSIELIIVLAALAGLASESYRPASSALLTDLVPAGRRVTAFAAYRLAINLGFSAGPAVAGLLAQRSFLLVFLIDAATSAVLGVVMLVMPRAAVPPHAAAPGDARGLVGTLLADRAFLVFLLASGAGALVYFQQFAALPLQVVADGHSTALYGLLMSLNGLAVTGLELPLVAITRRLPPRPVMALGSLCVGAGFAATGLVSAAPALAGTVMLWTFGEMLTAPVSSAWIADISPPHMRGRYAGVSGMAFGVAFIAGPAGGTALYSVDPHLLWAVCAALGAASAALLLLPIQPLARDHI